ncbi:MAG: hypothetical protein M0Z41_14955 [Peptococcaceae bacterium]|nr:hypothetical protein [Peptococcaceae bacterium]
MYEVDRMTLDEIAAAVGVSSTTVKAAFNEMKIERLGTREQARLKREKDFDRIYDLHFRQQIPIAQIHRQYGFSKCYIRQVLKDRGLRPVDWRLAYHGLTGIQEAGSEMGERPARD